MFKKLKLARDIDYISAIIMSCLRSLDWLGVQIIFQHVVFKKLSLAGDIDYISACSV